MHDNFDIHPVDLDTLAEIVAMTDLMIAAADTRVDQLTAETIDRILHVV
jgi:hypothetical protein